MAWSSSHDASQKSPDTTLEQRLRVLEQRGNGPTAPFVVMPSQTPSPTMPSTAWPLPNGGTLLNNNQAPVTPWLVPPRP